MKVLNVGGNNKSIPIPHYYDGWEHHILDIDPKGEPEICCDAVELKNMTGHKESYDSVYCSHNLEHFYRHKVKDVLEGFSMVLNEDGFCYIAVPHLLNVMRRVVAFNMNLTDTMYEVSAGAITPHDILYGWGKQMETSGEDFFAHKCGFTPKMLREDLIKVGFPHVYIIEIDLNLVGLAFKKPVTDYIINKIIGAE